MPTLVYSDANGVDRSFALGAEPVLVGRGPECAIRSDDPRVSRAHARFFVEQGALWVEDLGSSNGIYVGPNKVQRAPVPTGEIVLIGSLVLRLLPASGTLPPPHGLHGTLATWLDLERKTRVAVEEERDAFARRVKELHHQLAELREAHPSPSVTLRDRVPLAPDAGETQPGGLAAEAIRMRDEADAQVARLEQALAAMQDELDMLRKAAANTDAGSDLVRLRDELAQARARVAALELSDAEWSESPGKTSPDLAKVRAELDEVAAARSVAEHLAAEAQRESQDLRHQLDELRRSSSAELEIAQLDAARARDHQAVTDTAAGVAAAEKLAEADLLIASLQREIAQLKKAAPGPDPKLRELAEDNSELRGRVEKAEKELAAAQIRAQGAERTLAHANAQAAKSESRVSQAETRMREVEARSAQLDSELAKLRDQIADTEQRLGATTAPLADAVARGERLASELAAATGQLASAKQELATARRGAEEAEARARASEQAGAALQRKLDGLATAEAEVGVANRSRQEAAERVAAAEAKCAEAERRSDAAEQRASAADTMAKAMAKDLAEALSAASRVELRSRSAQRELEQLQRRSGESEAAIQAAQAEATSARERADRAEAALRDATAELSNQHSTEQAQLASKLTSLERELAAERSTALALVDRKTQLERELAEARERLAAAEHKISEFELTIENLQERILDLESKIAVDETAQQASLGEAREAVAELERELASVREELTAATARLADSERARQAAERSAVDQGELAAARERADAGDLAIGRAHALQRQLDEAISKIAWLERDAAAREAAARDAATRPAKPDPAAEARIAQADARAAASEQARRELEHQLTDTAAELRQRVEQLTDRDNAARELATQLAERDAALAAAQAAVAQASQVAPSTHAMQTLHDDLARARQTIIELEREVAAADNVRSFAAETEREIAQLQRELREARSQLTQMTLERDRLALDLRDARADDDETTGQRPISGARPLPSPPERDSEVTAALDVEKIEPLVARIAELERQLAQAAHDGEQVRAQLVDSEQKAAHTADALRQRLAAVEQQATHDSAELRRQLAATQQQLEDAIEDADAEETRTASAQSIELAEHLSVLEESIDSLRANMRAASDEAAVMPPSESVMTIASAVSQAAEHVERARAAIRALVAAMTAG